MEESAPLKDVTYASEVSTLNAQQVKIKIQETLKDFGISMVIYVIHRPGGPYWDQGQFSVSDTSILGKKECECSYQELNLRHSEY